MKITNSTVMHDDAVRMLAAPTFLAARYEVRVLIAPNGAGVPGDDSALGTAGITLARSGHVPWSPPV